MPIRATIWDLGGVLVRTEDRQPRTETARQLGMTYEELESLVFDGPTGLQAALGEIQAEQHWQSICSTLNLPSSEMLNLQKGFWGGDRVDHELVEYIRGLKAHYRTALLSNAFSNLRWYLQNEWKIIDAFDEVIISSEAGLIKPDPKIYQMAVERLRVAPFEAVFVDDFQANVAGAREAGLHAVHFRNASQARMELEALLKKE
jgi:epoxide hydrolase-like predicted phosphatase